MSPDVARKLLVTYLTISAYVESVLTITVLKRAANDFFIL